MRFALIILAAGALSGCASIGVTSMDERRQVRLVTYETIGQVDAACRDAGYKALPFPLTILMGCAVYTKESCTVYAKTPENGWDTEAFELLGHEAFHCFAGNWHNDEQKVHASIKRSPQAGEGPEISSGSAAAFEVSPD